MDTSQQKEILRQDSLHYRNENLTTPEDAAIADLLFRFLLLSPKNAIVMLYLSTEREFPTLELADSLAKARPDLRLYAPRILSSVKRGARMEMYPIPRQDGTIDWSAMTTNAWGITEPPPSPKTTVGDIHSDMHSFCCVLVPALLLDKQGYRLGYGGGYYDRYLANVSSNFLLLSPCRSYAFTDELPHESYDTQVHYLFLAKSIWETKPYSGNFTAEQRAFLQKNLPAKKWQTGN